MAWFYASFSGASILMCNNKQIKRMIYSVRHDEATALYCRPRFVESTFWIFQPIQGSYF